MSRPWNFSAGPAALPEAVLRQVQEELLDWHGSGMSVMEMSHRGKEFGVILQRAEADLRELLGVPANYKVLFLQGGATQQFAQIPLNLLGEAESGRSADFLVTGSWSKKAVKEAQRVARGRLAGTTEDKGAPADGFTRLPAASAIAYDPQAAYFHLCTNETIHGIEVHDLDALLAQMPADVPVVADMSSHILSRPVDVSRYGLIYAGAQKNIGPSGLTLVIVRDDLLGDARKTMPSVMDFAVMAENQSMINTPPTFAIYIAGLVFQWLKAQGGLRGIEAQNIAKAELLYGAIDGSTLYQNAVHADCRSRMNIPFTLSRPELDAAFLAESKAAGLLSLKGHKSVGGMRASIYNAIPLEGVQALVDFMRDFERRNT